MDSVLYLAIALSLVVAGLSMYGNTASTAKSFDQTSVLAALVAETRVQFTAIEPDEPLPALTASALDLLASPTNITETLIAAEAVPADIINPGVTGALRNAWGGRIAVLAGRGNDGQSKIFIYMDRVPSQACMRLSSSDATGKGIFSDGMERARFIGTVGGTTTDRVIAYPITLSMLSGADYCGSGAQEMTLIYELSLR